MAHPDRERHEQIKRLFLEIQRLPADERARRLDRARASDASLRAELDALLEEGGDSTGLMDHDIEGLRTTATASAWESLLEQLRSRGPGHSRYDFQGEIARGGMGVIHRVFDRDAGRTLALKLMLDAVGDGANPDEEDRSLGRFLGEAQLTSRLDHPGVVPVHEIGVDGAGRVYFTMKLVQGDDLRAVFQRVHDPADAEWTTTRALNVMLRICEAMAYAHDKGIIHRDLKPANVMVGAHGEAYVMDWGLARVLGQSDPHDPRIRGDASVNTDATSGQSGSPILTADGAIVGTPAYMSPEQARGETARIGPATDVYAVGVMLYHLIGCRPPYTRPGDDNSPWAILARIEAGRPTPLLELAPDTPAELVAIVERAMGREIPERYDDMSALASDLRAFLEDRVVAAYETGAWAEAKKWVRRNCALAAALAAGLLATSGLGFGLAWQERRTAEVVAEERDKQATIAGVLEEILRGASPSVHKGRDSTMLREMLDATVSSLDDGRLQATPEAEARLRRSIGQTYWDLGAYERAKTQYTQSVELRRNAQAADPLGLADGLGALALALTALNEYDAAERAADEAQAIRERSAGRDNVGYAESLSILGHIGMWRGDYRSSKELLEEAVALLARHEPHGDEKSVGVLSDLALVCYHRGEYEESIRHYDAATDLIARVAPDDPTRFMIALSRASALQQINRFDEAEQGYFAALHGLREMLPESHPWIANALNELGSLHEVLGEFDEARRWWTECLEILQDLGHGSLHNVAIVYHNLALLEKRAGDLEASERMIHRALAIRRDLFPNGDRATAQSIHNYGVLKEAMGDLDGADELYLEALDMRRRLFPGDHSEIVLSLHDIGSLRLVTGDAEEALRLQTEALEMSQRLFGDAPNLTVIQSLEKIARTYEALGRLEDARENAAEAVEQRIAVFGSVGPGGLDSVIRLGRLEKETGNPEAAILHLETALGVIASTSRPVLEATLRAELGHCLTRLRRFDEAESALLAARDVLVEHNDTGGELRSNLVALVDLYREWNDAAPDAGHDQARAKWSEALSRLSEVQSERQLEQPGR